ncbi:hypothetical protein, partial [Leptospira interrogans]|uniref:hypothetical protein n=1 Tax=Leptospira interrogans TaxID=173 RepID=UPI0007738B21
AIVAKIPKELQHYVATARSNIEFKRGREPLYTIIFASDSPKYSPQTHVKIIKICRKKMRRNSLKV